HGLDAGCLRAVAACDFAGWDCPGVVDSCSNEAPQPWQSELNTLLSSVCYDRVVPFVWNFESQLDSTLNQRNDQALRLHERIRDEASGLLASRSTTSGDLVDVHFVAHSRGAVLLAHTLSLLQV